MKRVAIIGAGISGISAAYHIQEQHKEKYKCKDPQNGQQLNTKKPKSMHKEAWLSKNIQEKL